MNSKYPITAALARLIRAAMARPFLERICDGTYARALLAFGRSAGEGRNACFEATPHRIAPAELLWNPRQHLPDGPLASST